MGVKQEILGIFEANRDRQISGEELARDLGVSRSAVWKAVRALKEDGHDILAAPNQGYVMTGRTDILSPQSISRHLAPDLSLSIEVHKELDSTNLLAKRLGAQGMAQGHVVVAERQSAGRGRLGRSFHSPTGTGIYMSILVRPKIPVSQSLHLTTAAAVAVAEAIECVSGREAHIKWVNDVYVEDKKVCGILTEASMDLEGGTLEYAAVGIGINARAPEGGFPSDIVGVAGAALGEDDFAPDARSRLAAGVLSRFWRYYQLLPDRPFHAEYVRRSMVVGRDVLVHRGGASAPARAMGIDGDCRLIVEYPNGEIHALESGEVSVRPVAI